MAAVFKYILPVEETHWKFQGAAETTFTWNYDTQSEDLLRSEAKPAAKPAAKSAAKTKEEEDFIQKF